MKASKQKQEKVKELKAPNKRIVRFPRPLGTTSLSLQLQQENNQITKDNLLHRIRKLLIEQWASNGMMLNNRVYTVDEFSLFLNIPSITLIKLMNEELTKIGKFFEDKEGKQLARVSLFRSLFWALENQSIAKSQLHILMADQGQRYVPFLSAEVNKAIANSTNAIKPMLDILKLMMEKTSDNPLLPNTTTNNNLNIYVSPDEANRMIQDKGLASLLEDEGHLEQKMAILSQASLPEVNATYQNLTNIGIKYDGTKLKESEDHTDDRNEDIEAIQ